MHLVKGSGDYFEHKPRHASLKERINSIGSPDLELSDLYSLTINPQGESGYVTTYNADIILARRNIGTVSFSSGTANLRGSLQDDLVRRILEVLTQHDYAVKVRDQQPIMSEAA